MSKFIEWPWRLRTAVADQGQPLVIYPPDGNQRIAKICISKGELVMEANARLIAAAPELYKACKEALESRNMQIPWSTLKKIQQALVKADGIGGSRVKIYLEKGAAGNEKLQSQ